MREGLTAAHPARGLGPRIRRIVAVLVLLAGPAAADEATWSAADAAVAADRAASEHCATGWGGRGVTRADALIGVGTALKQVETVYERAQEPFLLYWRGVLYKCLGQYEDALDDLQEFVAAETGNPAYADQLKAASLHLERAGRRIANAGSGAAAGWIRRPDSFELGLRYGAAGGLRERACTERSVPAQLHTWTCVGSDGAIIDRAPGLSPVVGALVVRGFAHPVVGLGGGLRVRYTLPHESVDAAETDRDLSIDLGPTAPRLDATVGPAFRTSNRLGGGRAYGLRVEPAFAVAYQTVEPFAGHYDYAEGAQARQLQGGQWRALALGAAIAVEGQVEVGSAAVLLASGRFAGYVPASGDLLEQVVEPAAAVEVPLQPVQVEHLSAGARLAILGVPPKGSGVLAIGAELFGDFDGLWIRMPEGGSNTWGAGWKVSSTRRLAVAIGLAFRVEIGAQGVGGSPSEKM